MKNSMESIQELIEVLNSSSLTEIGYEEEGFKVTIKKPVMPQPEERKEIKKKSAPKAAESKDMVKEVKCYNIGRFYYHDAQGQPIIYKGKKIKAGQEIGYISTVGVKTPVKSNYTGMIEEVALENGEIADYGKTLLKITVES